MLIKYGSSSSFLELWKLCIVERHGFTVSDCMGTCEEKENVLDHDFCNWI